MKAKLLILILLLACALGAQAQGTLLFRATLTGSQVVPPNGDPTIARGDFWLTGNVLSFQVDVPLVTFITMSATIKGPALPGENAPSIFDLGGAGVYPGSSLGDPPGYRFFSPFDGTFGAGPFTLTPEQINQLQSGLWYVNITSSTMPEGQLRGQIFPVPEPPTFGLVGLAGAILAGIALRRRKGSVILIAASVCFAASVNETRAQGTLEFHADLNASNAVPLNANYAWTGVATFTLSGDTLGFAVAISREGAFIERARLVGLSTAPVLDLGQPLIAIHWCDIFLGCDPGATYYWGSLLLTPQQRTGFLAGGIALGLTPARYYFDSDPIGEVFGGIVPVPEPSVTTMLTFGLGALAWRCRNRFH